MSNIKKLVIIISVDFAFSILVWLLLISGWIQMTKTLQESLVAAIFGSGILAALISASYFYLQSSVDYDTNKSKVRNFYTTTLVVEVSDVAQNGDTLWDLGESYTFYFDQSLINPMFNVYKENFDRINEYLAYFPNDTLVSKYRDQYIKTRAAYTQARKLDNMIFQAIREHLHSKGVDSVNDGSTRAYVKGKYFAKLPDSAIIKHLNWNSVPTFTAEVETIVANNKTIQEMTTKVKKSREELSKLAEKTSKLH